MAETRGDKRGWATTARVVAPGLALAVGLDEIARAAGAWWLVEKIAAWVPPFAKAHEPRVDIFAIIALAGIAIAILKVFRPMLPDEIRGVGYLALLIAVGIAFYVVTDPASSSSRAGKLTASDASQARSSGTAGGGRTKASKSGLVRQAMRRTSASAVAPTTKHFKSPSVEVAASTGSSAVTEGVSVSHVVAHTPASHRGTTSQSATHAPVHTTQSPSVEFEGSKSAAAAPSSKVSSAVEVASEKEHASGIEIANN